MGFTRTQKALVSIVTLFCVFEMGRLMGIAPTVVNVCEIRPAPPSTSIRSTIAPVLPRGVEVWDTTDTDPTASMPDATDPTRMLPASVQATFACIRYHESRNHLTSRNIHSGAEGWYQFTPSIWRFIRSHLPGLPASPSKATGDQQSMAAIWVYTRNNGFHPEWNADSCF